MLGVSWVAVVILATQVCAHLLCPSSPGPLHQLHLHPVPDTLIPPCPPRPTPRLPMNLSPVVSILGL